MTNDQEGPLTITAAAELIRSGSLTPSELLEQCLKRLYKYEERVRAWVHLDRDGAREQAARLTAEVKAGQYRGPLHGIPIGVKDIIDVFDMPTGCGSQRWAQSYARRDATCVERLRQAGAVVMGKTVTTAFASFDPPVTRNPWNPDRTPGGSSSGSAAAVACGMCLGALATQTGGSITRPASYCGVYSLKPTYGRVSVDGVLPLAPSLDHVGVMANCVRDLAVLFQPLVDFGSGPHITRKPFHYLTGLEGSGLENHKVRRLYDFDLTDLPDFPATADPEMAAAFRELIPVTHHDVWTRLAGALPSSFALVPQYHHTLMAVEAATYHIDRLQRHPDDYPPKIRALIEHGIKSYIPHAVRVWDHHTQFQKEIDDAFGDPRHVFITPATVGPAPTAETTGDPAFNSPWSYAGLPTISLPFAWSSDGLPLAAQLIGSRWNEDDLFWKAASLEETVRFERRPLPL